jgi:Type IV secretion system pilin
MNQSYFFSFLLLAALAVTSLSGVTHAAGGFIPPVTPDPQTINKTPQQTVNPDLTKNPSPTVGNVPSNNPSPTVGNTDGGDTGGSLVNPLNSINSLSDFLKAILGGVVEIGAIFLTLMIVYVGFLFVAARGNEEKIRSARDALMWTVIGGLLLLGAQAIELVIEATVKTL